MIFESIGQYLKDGGTRMMFCSQIESSNRSNLIKCNKNVAFTPLQDKKNHLIGHMQLRTNGDHPLPNINIEPHSSPTRRSTIMASGTVIVTGANGGLGSAFVQNLLSTSYHGIFTVRGLSDQSSGRLKQILSLTSMSHAIVSLDLGSLAAVRAFAEDINAKVSNGEIPRIRALVLNAGMQSFHGIKYTTDGIETTFAVNYLANFLLVLLLLKSMDPEKGRIVTISSWSHDTSFYMNVHVTDKLVFRDPEVMAYPDYEDKKGEDWPAGMRRYGLSKLCLLMFVYPSRL